MSRMWMFLAFPTLAACTGRGEDLAAHALPASQCFNVAMIQGFRTTGQNTLRVDAGPGRTYEIRVSGPLCDQVDWAQSVALRASSSSWLCAGSSVGQGSVTFRDLATAQSASCYIDEVRPVETATDAH